MQTQLRMNFDSPTCHDMSPLLTPPVYDPGPPPGPPPVADDFTPDQLAAARGFDAHEAQFARDSMDPSGRGPYVFDAGEIHALADAADEAARTSQPEGSVRSASSAAPPPDSP